MIKTVASLRAIVHYVLIYILIIFQGSIFFKNYQDFFYLGTILVVGLWCLLKGKLRDVKYFGGIFLFVGLLLITVVLSGNSLSFPTILNYLSRFLLIYFVYDYNRERFCDRYVLLMSTLAGISLLFFVIQRIDTNIIAAILPDHINAGQVYQGTFIYTMAPTHMTKNVGIFAEPGLYQIVLSSAMFILLYMKQQLSMNKRQYNLCFAVLAAAFITAQSTTGYLSLIILMTFYMLRLDQKKTISYRIYIIMAIVCFLLWDISRGQSGMIYENFIAKLFNESGNLDLTVSTGAARYYSMLADLTIANRYPLGAGFTKYAELWHSLLKIPLNDVASCAGLTYSMATIGYVNTLYVLCFYFWLMNKNFTDVYMKCAYILLFVNITLAQPSIYFVALMVLLLVDCKKGTTSERK